MKRLLVTLTVVGILALGAGAFAFGPGWFGGTNMMGSTGYGGMMMGGMMGPGMMGWNTGQHSFGYDQKFLDETRELRKELNDKRFEYFEALRDPEGKPDKIAKLEKEISELQQKLYKKSPQITYSGSTYGRVGAPCWQ